MNSARPEILVQSCSSQLGALDRRDAAEGLDLAIGHLDRLAMDDDLVAGADLDVAVERDMGVQAFEGVRDLDGAADIELPGLRHASDLSSRDRS